MTSTRSTASSRLLSQDALAASLVPDAVDGSPLPTSYAVLAQAPAEVGVWEAAPGSDVDVEAEELFVVLAGRGTVRFDDGSELTLRPGAVVHLREGDRTTWTVTETLRKVYVQLPTG